ncbi:hypothetical protein [Paenibacillus ihuae]|uniref:hypothetical protein n=1 Tax=Paenibacillus ihuae TaxID=1232431 RepID=UPI0006D5951D|nr:hypothetical protein [Paenibacillus ihuae]
MKKIVVTTMASLLLLTGASAFAASTSLVGQKVQGLFSIEQGGKKVADAVIINGVAYAPVRAVANAAGTSLKVEGKKIIMEDASAAQATTAPNGEINTVNTTEQTTPEDLQAEREKLTKAIEQKKANITDLETNVIPPYEIMAKELANNGDLGKRAQASADEYKKLLEQRKAELIVLEQQLVEVDAQIAALQK